MRAVKKPVIVECHPAKVSAFVGQKIPIWLGNAISEGDVSFTATGDVVVMSKEGVVSAPRDSTYIMLGVEGEIYLCNESIFFKTYEILE